MGAYNSTICKLVESELDDKRQTKSFEKGKYLDSLAQLEHSLNYKVDKFRDPREFSWHRKQDLKLAMRSEPVMGIHRGQIHSGGSKFSGVPHSGTHRGSHRIVGTPKYFF